MSDGTLYICPTPIGNLEDITLRALRILKEVDCIFAEDTRVTRKLLNHYEIETSLKSYHKHSEKEKAQQIMELLMEGKDIALVSDAGTPLVSDPGCELLSEVTKNNIKIVPLPGASAVLTSLCASPLVEDGFIFAGFLPRQHSKKKELLNRLLGNELPVIIFESPGRVVATLEAIKEVDSGLKVTIARELTKIYEQIITLDITEAIETFNNRNNKGEFTIIIEKRIQQKEVSESELKNIILKSLEEGKSTGEVAREIAYKKGLSKNMVYKKALKLAKNSHE